jgi:hypothetical protein
MRVDTPATRQPDHGPTAPTARDRGGARLDALWRLIYLIPLVLGMYVLGFVLYVFFGLWFTLDIIWQLITGRPGLQPGGRATTIHEWLSQNTRFVFFGAGSWSWTP